MKRNVITFLSTTLFLLHTLCITSPLNAQSRTAVDGIDHQNKEKLKRNYFRISLDGQLYGPSPTQYSVPQVDSFSLKGSRLALSYQLGIKTEITDPANDNWAIIFSVGFGANTIAHHFSAPAAFTRDSIEHPGYLTGGGEGVYVMPAIGVAYKHPFGKSFLQHSFSTSFVVPFLRDPTEFGAWEASTSPDFSQFSFPLDFTEAIYYERINFSTDGTNQVLFGLEYQPEWLFRLDKPVFIAVGLVCNYSMGIVSRGDVRISNGRTIYHGTLKQGFSKIGISTRVGFNSNYKRKSKM